METGSLPDGAVPFIDLTCYPLKGGEAGFFPPVVVRMTDNSTTAPPAIFRGARTSPRIIQAARAVTMGMPLTNTATVEAFRWAREKL